MNRILIAVDDSDRSEDAVVFGGLLARATGAPVTVAHVHAWGPAAVALCAAHFAGQAERMFARFTPRLEGTAGLETCALPGPSAVHALHGLAERVDAGMVVVGSSHTGRHGRVFPGSTAERLLHGAPCPVAVVPIGYRSTDEPALRAIGCAWKGFGDSDAGLPFAEALAARVGASLRVIRVVEDRDVRYAPEVRATLEAFMAGHRDDVRRELEGKVSELGQRIEVSGDLRDGDAVTQLVAASGELDALVVGSRGYGPLGAVLLGGVSGPLMRMASCPVIVHPNGIGRLRTVPQEVEAKRDVVFGPRAATVQA